MPIETEKRLIDANLNRLREGIRVVEDIARYILNDFALASSLKTLRHKARVDNSAFDATLLQHRDIKNDILKLSTPSEKARENLRDIALANFKRSEESARVLEEIFKLDSAQSAESKKDLCEAPENSPASWCKKSDSRLQKCNRRFFARSGESEALPLKAKKRSFLGTHFKKVGGSGAGGAALLRKEISELSGEGFAESNAESQSGLPRRFCESARNDDSVLDSANQRKSAESSAICEIFKAIRYELYDIEIAYFKALEKIENKNI